VIDRLHAAVVSGHVFSVSYRDKSGAGSEREAEPLCLAFWGGVWTLGACCRLRCDFRNFRPDRIARFETIGETFIETAERGLKGYLRHVGADPEAA
jgi:predicted DNA-binding transcriptional regulator YafY